MMTAPTSRKPLRRTQANYSGLVTFCDRWFGFLMETLRVLGLLDNTMVIFTTDHGHSIGDRGYMGKRGYPSTPEVYEVPLMLRFPGAQTRREDQRHVRPTHRMRRPPSSNLPGSNRPNPLTDGLSSTQRSPAPKPIVYHVTVGWGSTPTVITDQWWFNCKVDGTGVLFMTEVPPTPSQKTSPEISLNC